MSVYLQLVRGKIDKACMVCQSACWDKLQYYTATTDYTDCGSCFRNAMPSLLENLQRRLDDLPVPHILHRPHGNPAREVAAGLEASPRLRVRAFPPQPQAQQQQPASAARPFVRPQRIPSSRQQPPEEQGASRQPHLPAQTGWDILAEAQSVHSSMPASDAWLADLPDTPEAPRAASVAERQAIADVLFEEAAGQSAEGDIETVSEDPSWLDDAAAYDAAAAAAEIGDDLSALEVLSDDDDTPVNGARSQVRLNLSHLEHLMLLSDSEEEDEGMSDAGDPALPDEQVADRHIAPSLAAMLSSGDAGVFPPHAFATSGQVSALGVQQNAQGLPAVLVIFHNGAGTHCELLCICIAGHACLIPDYALCSQVP